MKKILKELCIGLFTIVLLNSSNLVNVFAAENSSVSESENLYSNYEQVTQIAIPDENGNLRFYTGIEAQKIYNQIEKENVTEEINNNSLQGLFNYDTYKLSTNNGIDTCGMFTYKYRFVTSSKGTKYGSNRRISPILANGTSSKQSMEVSVSASVSWNVNASLSGGYKDAFNAAVGSGWCGTKSFSETLTINVAPHKKIWLEFKPRVNFVNGESQKYYVTRGPKKVTVVESSKKVYSESPRTVTMQLGDKNVKCPDGMYVWKESNN